MRLWALLLGTCAVLGACGSSGDDDGPASAGDGGGGGATNGGAGTGGAGTAGLASGATGGMATGGTGGTGGSMSQDQGGSPTSGGTAAGGSANAGASGASEGGAPASGGSAGAAEGGAPEAGTAGEAPSAGTGGEPGDPTACSASYDGPLAGPRADGPDPVMETCDSLSDDVIRARYDDPDAKVPKGLFWEPPGLMVTWEDPCSEAPDETLGRFMDAGLGTLNGQFSTDWFFETSYCNGDSRWFYRNLRCDYYDGTLSVAGQASVNHQNLAFLASLLWYQNFSNLGGSAIIGYATSSGASEESIELCTVRTVFGDFGLCDEIALDSTVYRLDTAGDGTVTIEGPVNLRSIQGTCH